MEPSPRGLTAVEVTQLRYLSEEQGSGAISDSCNGSELFGLGAEGLILCDQIGDASLNCVNLLFDFAKKAAA